MESFGANEYCDGHFLPGLPGAARLEHVTCCLSHVTCCLLPAACCLLPFGDSLMVDLYPLALHVSLSDLSGRAGGRERLVLTSHHVQIRGMLEELLYNLDGRARGLARREQVSYLVLLTVLLV